MMLLTSDERTRYKCPCCTHTEEIDAGSSHVILTRRLQSSSTFHTKYLTKDLVHDKTLPIVRNVLCPFCKTGTDVIYVKYSKDLTYLYMCKTCERFWKNGEKEQTLPEAPEPDQKNTTDV
jgi:DNA-directed RNA polymerase subunit M/transcription elongation factor TFIIS